MRTKKENVLARSPLLRGAFCATLLAFVACGGGNSSNTNSTEMGCASNQAKPTENYTSSTLMSQILESLKGEPKVDPLGLFKEDTRTVQQKIEKYGIGFKKGNDDLRNQVQKTLDEMFKDGTVYKIAQNYSDYHIPEGIIHP